MAEINIKRFVDVNILTNVQSTYSGTRGMLTLYTPEGVSGHEGATGNVFTSYADAAKELNSTTFAQTLAYLKIFFDHGGASVHVIEGTAYGDLTAELIRNLPMDRILIGCVIPVANVTAGFTAMINLATSYNTSYYSGTNSFDVYRKIFFARTADNTVSTDVPCLAVKYSNVAGADMTMAAYLSKIDVYGQNTVNDYSFTSELINYEDLTDTQLGTTLDNHMNVDLYLGNNTRNVGGDLKDGADFTNTFVLIVLIQTVTQRLLDLLVQKIKNSTGLGQIYATISSELDAYKNSGYYSTDKIWEKETLTISKNQQTYTIIEKGTPLLDGYYVRILPFTSLEEDEKVARKAPYIYIIVADQYGIRNITINGEVI